MGKLARLTAEERAPGTADARVRRIPRLRTRYYAFLSYSHRDKELADWLHRELERFRVPRSIAGTLTANGVVPRRLSPIFRDQQDLSAGGELADEIKAALAASQFLVVLCSPAAAKSRWTNQEIESFKRTRPEGCVLAAVVAGEPFASDMPGRKDEECFPPALRFKYDRRGHQTAKRAEPLAADFRESGEGKRLALLKLVAGMLGVGLDELVQRETTRRQRRLAYLAAGSLAGMTVTSGLAIVALEARDAARDQRREAEGLVEFMLGDLRTKLEPIGRLDALDGVGSRVLAYYKNQDASELTDAALLQRSRALNLIAQVAYLRGNLAQADALYRQALAGTAETVRRSPADPKVIFDHAQNVFWIGEIARGRGQTEQAIAAYNEYKRLADRLVAIEPDNMKWRMEGLYAVEDVGISLYNKRRFDEAARQFAAALQPMESLAAVNPNNLTFRKELGTVLAWLADARRAQGNLDEAIALRERQVSLLSQAVAAGVTDVDLRSRLIPAHQGLGNLFASRGLSDRSVTELRTAVAEAESLVPVEPTNAQWKRLAAGARLDLARTLLSLGRRDDAARETDAACSALAEMHAGDIAAWTQTACLTMRARLTLQTGASADATGFAQRALASAQNVHSADPLKDRYMIASIYRLLGDARRGAGDSQGARAAWSQALAALPQGVVEFPSEIDEHATVLERVGRANEARPLVNRLQAIGYRTLG
jgi:tetratricopeptide (TPR) repeat protein